MALARHEFVIQDAAGNLETSVLVEVRNEATGLLAVLYSDRDGLEVMANPFNADAVTGIAAFHVVGGAYRISATTPSGTRTMRYVKIGRSAETDPDQLAAEAIAEGTLQRKFAVHVESHGAVGFELEDIQDAQSFAGIVDDTEAFEAAIEQAITEGHKRVVYDKCHAINIKYDTRLDSRYRGLQLIGPGGRSWREARAGVLTPYNVDLPAVQLGDDDDPEGGQFMGFIGHNLYFDDVRYVDEEENYIPRGGKYGFKTVGFREMELHGPFFGGLADTAWEMVGGVDGSFYNHIFGARFAVEGAENSTCLFADEGTSFITTTWFHGVSIDEGSDGPSGRAAILTEGRDVQLTFFGGWAQLTGSRIFLTEKGAGLGSGILEGYNVTLEGSGVCLEVDLLVSGGGAFRTAAHNHVRGTWNFTNDVEIETFANGYSGDDTPGVMSGGDVTALPTLDTYSKRGHQRILEDGTEVSWILPDEGDIAWLDISQNTTLNPAEIFKGGRHTLFVRAVGGGGSGRQLTFGTANGVTTHVTNFAGNIQENTVTRFDFRAVQIPSGDLVLIGHATERYLANTPDQPLMWRAHTATGTGSNVNTAQPWFPSQSGFEARAGTSYRFRGRLHLTRAAGSTSHTTSLLFGGTATLSSIAYTAFCKTGDAAGLAAANMVEAAVATATQIKAASTSTTEVISVWVEGVVRINAAGTFTPQFQYSAAPGGAPSIATNTFFEMTPIGASGTFLVGRWS